MSVERKHLAVLGGLWLLLYMLGNNLLVVTDPVECNYTETAYEMLESGNYFSPRIFGNYWFDKPILFYWEVMAAFKVFGYTDFAARLAPALMMGVALLLLYWWGRRLYGARTALAAALIMATSLESWYVGHAIITDTTLLVTVSLALMAFYNGYREGNYNWYYLSFASAGLAVLDKGPIGLCLPGLIVLLFLLWQRDLKVLFVRQTLIGFVLFFLVVSIWYVPMYLLHGQAFIDVFLGGHNVMRATVSEHPEYNVWYYYLVVFLLGFFPWVLAAIPALVKRWRGGWRLTLDADTRFLLVWAVTVFGVFECFATKYVTYTFPYMFPVVLLMARHFCQWGKKLYYAVAALALFYVVLLFGVAVPQMARFSTQSMAVTAAPYLEKGIPVYSYGRHGGVVSFTYYTGQYIYDLVSPEEEAKQSQKMDWSITHISPTKNMADIEKDSAFLLIATEKAAQEMQERFPGKWQMLEGGHKRQLYYRTK